MKTKITLHFQTTPFIHYLHEFQKQILTLLTVFFSTVKVYILDSN